MCAPIMLHCESSIYLFSQQTQPFMKNPDAKDIDFDAMMSGVKKIQQDKVMFSRHQNKFSKKETDR